MTNILNKIFKGKVKKILTNWRVILLIIFLIMAVWVISYNPSRQGVAIRSVAYNSSIHSAGIEKPAPNIMPMSREIILAIDNQPIQTTKDYFDIIESLEPNTTVDIRTSKESYRMYVRPTYDTTILDELEEYEAPVMINVTKEIDGEEVVVQEQKTETIVKTIERTVVDSETGETYTVSKEVNETNVITETKTRNKIHQEIIGKEEIGLSIYQAPTSNIKKGLDLEGGTRVILAPDEDVDDQQLEFLVEIIKSRLNVYGLSDISVRPFGFGEEKYIIVEIAGATKQEVVDLLSKQGKFEAKIKNETVFIGGEDITYVCTDSTCSRIYMCGEVGPEQWTCKFEFSIKLSAGAAKKFGEATGKLDIIEEQGNSFLSEPINLYLDDSEVDSLRIDSKLRGSETTDISISGAGSGRNKQEAALNADENRKELRTVLKTGSLPVKLNIENSVIISAIAGGEFVSNSIKVGLMAILSVGVVIFLIYRKLKISIPLLITSLSEVVLLLGLAALLKWNLDFAAIAGIIVVVGTGVDHLIVITDEVLRGESGAEITDWKKRFKTGFMIILIAFFTTSVAMIPLVFAGAGLLRGFAIITIAGLALGIFISRPAYGAVIEILMKD